mgnify:CR=1 FL=1
MLIYTKLDDLDKFGLLDCSEGSNFNSIEKREQENSEWFKA